jgi:uncharacterized FlgJ-related protein
MFSKLSQIKKDLFFEVLDELVADFNGLKSQDREYLIMRIENNQFFNEANNKALKNSPLILRLLKEIYSWAPESNDESEFERKKNELIKHLIKVEKR